MASAKTVDEYIRGFPPKVQQALQNLRRTIKAVVPDAEEKIGYGMPGFKLNGWLVFYGGFKDHCSFFPASREIIQKFKDQLKSFETQAGTIHFTPDHPIPSALVRMIVKTRLKENELKAKARKSS